MFRVFQPALRNQLVVESGSTLATNFGFAARSSNSQLVIHKCFQFFARPCAMNLLLRIQMVEHRINSEV